MQTSTSLPLLGHLERPALNSYVGTPAGVIIILLPEPMLTMVLIETHLAKKHDRVRVILV